VANPGARETKSRRAIKEALESRITIKPTHDDLPFASSGGGSKGNEVKGGYEKYGLLIGGRRTFGGGLIRPKERENDVTESEREGGESGASLMSREEGVSEIRVSVVGVGPSWRGRVRLGSNGGGKGGGKGSRRDNMSRMGPGRFYQADGRDTVTTTSARW